MPPPVQPAHVEALRAFNRFYTRRIGVLAPYLASELSLAEVRLLYELAHRELPTASELGRDLGLDAGYLSRILRRFEQRGWIERAASPADGRQSLLTLTAAGQGAFSPLQQRSRAEAAAILAPLDASQREAVIDALARVQHLLEGDAAPRAVVLRDPAAGDLGWAVEQHGAVYAREFGYNAAFEAAVARIAARFLERFDAASDKGWIAEVDGERAGCVFVVRRSRTVAQLRMLLLLPRARGLGLGARLVDECIAFARACGYRKLMLWTQSHLEAARAIYRSRGFVKVKSERNDDYGPRLVSETWELPLA